MEKKIQNNQIITLYHNVWQKKKKKISNTNNNKKMKQETKATVKAKMVTKLCA